MIGDTITEPVITFKYISCYSLSVLRFLHLLRPRDSNTSHVTLYQVQELKAAIERGYSNTSHVTLYHCLSGQKRYSVAIQIHLMLLFINVANSTSKGLKKFKYISCYSLSVCRRDSGGFGQIQIHLMLLFISVAENMMPFHSVHSNTSHVTLYRRWNMEGQIELLFKYISCYSLSNRLSALCLIPVNSNTSHVTLYHTFRCETRCNISFKYISCYSLSFPGACRAPEM